MTSETERVSDASRRKLSRVLTAPFRYEPGDTVYCVKKLAPDHSRGIGKHFPETDRNAAIDYFNTFKTETDTLNEFNPSEEILILYSGTVTDVQRPSPLDDTGDSVWMELDNIHILEYSGDERLDASQTS